MATIWSSCAGSPTRCRRCWAAFAGVGEVTGEQLTGQPILQVRVDPQAIARYGVPTRNVLNVVEAVGTRKVGEVREGQRRFPLVVRLPDRQRTDPDALAATLIPTATGSVLPLNQVAQVVETEGPATINREWGRRRITVQCNVRGRDVGSFVAEAQKKIADAGETAGRLQHRMGRAVREHGARQRASCGSWCRWRWG